MLATHYLSPIIISIFLKYSWVLNQKELILCFDPVSEPLSAYIQRRRLQMLFMWCATSMHDRNVRIWRILRILYRMPHVNVPLKWIKMAVMGKKSVAVAPTDMAHHGAKANTVDGVAIVACRGIQWFPDWLFWFWPQHFQRLQSNVVVQTAAISACAKSSKWQTALWVLKRMEAWHTWARGKKRGNCFFVPFKSAVIV